MQPASCMPLQKQPQQWAGWLGWAGWAKWADVPIFGKLCRFGQIGHFGLGWKGRQIWHNGQFWGWSSGVGGDRFDWAELLSKLLNHSRAFHRVLHYVDELTLKNDSKSTETRKKINIAYSIVWNELILVYRACSFSTFCIRIVKLFEPHNWVFENSVKSVILPKRKIDCKSNFVGSSKKKN